VKNTLAPVIIFCIVLVVVAALSSFFFIIYLIGTKLYMLPVITGEMIVMLVPAALTQMLLPATLLSLLFALVRARRSPGLVFITYLALGALAFAVLFLAPHFIATSLTAEINTIRARGAVDLRNLEEPGKLVALEDAYLYYEKREGETLRSGVYVDSSGPAPRISTFDRAVIVRRGEEVTLTLPRPERTVALKPRVEEAASFDPGAQAGPVFEFLGGFNRRFLDAAASRPAEFLIVCVLFTAMVLSASFFLRVTHWPLANIFITLLVLSGVLALHNFIAQKVADELPKLFGPDIAFSLIPNGLLVFFSALFFLLDFVFLREKGKEPPGA
jgi:hypothetical protein